MNISIVRNTNGFCNYTVCSVACKIETKQEPCPFDCPTWNKTLNEVFWLSNCKKVICIGNDTIQPVPYECPPTTKISCSNGRTPVLVSDENTCCQHYECDCFCSGWGDPHYVTFDGLYYSFQGNCTYVLVQEIIPKYDQFKIYIDNVQCNLRDNVSCPRSIMVSYGTQKITLINKDVTGKVKLQVLVNDNVISLPFTGNGTEVYSAGINVVLQIPEINAVVTFGGIAFTINLPYRLFGNNTQGQCGTCNNNQADDCMLPGGRLVKDCAVMGDHWVTNKSKPYCIPPVMPTSKPSGTTKPPCKPDSVCDIIKSKVFAECHKVLPPEPFYQGCVFDSCHMKNSSIECSSLQTYASMCAQLGACVSWRDATKGICPPTCPPNLVYKSCHRAKQLTCDDNPYEDQDIIPLITEGCFCPDGTTMYNKQTQICVKECGCMDPNRKARKFGETFEYNCQNCICDVNMKGVRCEPKECPVKPKPDCSGPGFVTTSETSSTDPCCKELVCRCNASTCPPTQTDCPVGFKPTVVIPDGKCCPEYKCEKKGVCVYSNTEYQPGSSVPVDKCQLCSCTKDINLTTQLNIISCVPLPCNRTCEEGFQYVQSTTDCCGKCVQTHCVIKVDGTIHILQPGDNWSPPGDKCEQHNCEIITNTFVSIKTRIQCPPFNESKCQPETITTTEDGCCKTCVEKTCQLTTVKRSITQNGCKSPDVIEMTQCEGACSSYSMYSAEAASMQRKCSCCQEVKTHNRTIQLICPNGTTRPYTYIHVDECSCQIPQCRVP
ncbi:intestinal mucin-like protein [Lepisosteus oculatus]|uniref:intestinal mucin-like protein n=1 Tax=Lepisosteus oculatus TaxID=7918 RepID=UPI0035F51449